MDPNDFVNKLNPVTKQYELVPRPPKVLNNLTIDHYTERKQPEISKTRRKGGPKYHSGSKRSVRVLQNLRYDPITALVNQYRTLEKELDYHESVRLGTTIPLDAKGNIRRYDAEAHMRVHEMLAKIGNDLVRYGYARVPEGVPEGIGIIPSLIIQLPGANEPFIINQQPPVDEVEEQEED